MCVCVCVCVCIITIIVILSRSPRKWHLKCCTSVSVVGENTGVEEMEYVLVVHKLKMIILRLSG